MKKLLILLCGGCMLISQMGCTTVKRFRTVSYKSRDDTLVDLDLFSTQLTRDEAGPAGGTLWDLSAGAQTQFVQILDRRYPNNGQFIEALGREYPEAWTLPFDDLTEKKLRMVFTIRKRRDYTNLNDPSGRFSPADRIEYVTFRLILPVTGPLRFTRWNRFATEYGDFEIADITFSRNLLLEAEGELAGADISSRGTFSRNEEQVMRSRFLKLNGAMDDKWIEIQEEGTRETDLTGNVMADVALSFEGFPERITVPVFTANDPDSSRSPEFKTLIFNEVLVPRMENVPDTIKATLQMEYIYRHVQSGWKTYQEWDDKVEYYSGKVEKEVPLFTRRDYLPEFFCLGTGMSENDTIKVMGMNAKVYPLQFVSYRDASNVLDWLLNQEGEGQLEVGRYTLLYKGAPLGAETLTGNKKLRVMPVY